MKTSLLLALPLALVGAQSPPGNIVLSATYRDFLPIQCMNIANSAVQEEAEEALGVDNLSPTLGNTNNCQLLTDNTLWRNALINGEISGHPDFNAFSILKGQEDCSGQDNTPGGSGVNFPNGTCIFNSGRDETFAIVGREAVLGTNGLLKPQYCSDADGGETRCGFTFDKNQQTQTQKKWFDLWYNDDNKYNRRVGQRLELQREDNTDKFFFNGSGADSPDFLSEDNGIFFGPLDLFKLDGSEKIELTRDPNDTPAWPQSCAGCTAEVNGNNRNVGFWFTTELHTTFEFRADADMTFRFSGDDDFWTFVNGKLVVDVGGVHSEREKQVDLRSTAGGFDIQKFLGLEDRGVYTLDIFHAERQVVQSNFELETTLFAACNVVQSGTKSFSFNETEVDKSPDFEKDFISQGVTRNGKAIELLKSSETFAAKSVFTRIQENVLRGFSAKFDVTVSGNTNGFAFVVQAFGTDDLPKTTGNSFNLAGLTNSLAVVFDLCVDKVTCSEQEVSVHFPEDPSESIKLDSSSLRVHDRVLRNLKRNEPFPVEIIYYGGRPDFLEVYVNRSLYVRQSEFEVEAVIGSAGAHVGFTTSTGELAADITIENFELSVVEVEPSLTSFVIDNVTELQNVTANGVNVSEGIPIVTFDFCGNQLEAGTLQDQISAKYYEVRPSSDDSAARQDEEFTATVEDAVIIDNNDGTYTLGLRTEVVGEFALAVAFGEECEVLVDETESIAFLNKSSDSEKCFFKPFNDGLPLVISVPPEIPPTASPIEVNLGDGDETPILVIASASGGLVFIGCVAGIIFLGFRRKWNREKSYVKNGNMYRMDLNTTYTGNDEYRMTGAKLLETQQQILELQAQGKTDGRTGEISQLQAENKQMREMLKQEKKKNNVANVVHNNRRGKKKKKKAKNSFDELL